MGMNGGIWTAGQPQSATGTGEVTLLSMPFAAQALDGFKVRNGTHIRITGLFRVTTHANPAHTFETFVYARGPVFSGSDYELTADFATPVTTEVQPLYGTDQAGLMIFDAWWSHQLAAGEGTRDFSTCSVHLSWLWGDETSTTPDTPPADNYIQGRVCLNYVQNNGSTHDWNAITSIDLAVQWSAAGNVLVLEDAAVEFEYQSRLPVPSAFHSSSRPVRHQVYTGNPDDL